MGILGIEYICFSILNCLNVTINSWVGTLVGLLIFFVPLLLLLHMINCDKNILLKYKILSKMFFAFLIICIFLGIVVKILGIN